MAALTDRLARLQRLQGLRRTPGLIMAVFDRRGRAVLADIEDWIRDNPGADKATRRAVLDKFCRAHDFPTLDELEASIGGRFDGS